MSLRAINLTLKLHAREIAATSLLQARATYLASAAKWDKKTAGEFKKLLGELRRIAWPNMKPKKASASDLRQLFGMLGIPEAK